MTEAVAVADIYLSIDPASQLFLGMCISRPITTRYVFTRSLTSFCSRTVKKLIFLFQQQYLSFSLSFFRLVLARLVVSEQT